MMLSHLSVEANRVMVMRGEKNRDGDVIVEVVIGEGFGLFRTKSMEEIGKNGPSDFEWIGMLVGYQSCISDGRDNGGEFAPMTGDVCTWRGQDFYIGSVHERFDVHGVFAGYLLECSNQRSRRI